MKKFGFVAVVFAVLLFVSSSLPSSQPMEELEGTLEVIMATEKIGQKSCKPIYFVNARGKITQFSLPATAPPLSPGQKIKISGLWNESDRKKSFHCRKIETVAATFAKKTASADSVSDYLPEQTPVMDEQRTLVILIAFPDHTIPEWGKEKAENKVFASESINEFPNDHSDNAYWKECSNDKMWLTGKCLDGWKSMPKDATEYGYGPDKDELYYFDELEIDALTAVDPYVDFTQYDRLIFIRSGKNWGYAFATRGKNTFYTDDGKVELSTAFVNEGDEELRQDYISHELGHGFGLVHANSRIVSTGEINGYGDEHDNRGLNFAQLDSLHKYMLGWLEIDQIEILHSSITFWIDQRELNSDGIKLAVVPLGFTYENGIKKPILYYFEYFKELGEFDSKVFHDYDFEVDAKRDAVLLRKYKDENTYDSLVYTDGEEWPNDDVPVLGLLEEFCDSEYENTEYEYERYGICVQVLQKTGTGANAQAEVKITIPTPTPTPSPSPTPTPSPPPPPPSPPPIPTPTPSPYPTPTEPATGEVRKLIVGKGGKSLILHNGESKKGSVGALAEGPYGDVPVPNVEIKAKVIGKRKVMRVSPSAVLTDEKGLAEFTITANKKGVAKILFTAQSVKKILKVKVK